MKHSFNETKTNKSNIQNNMNTNKTANTTEATTEATTETSPLTPQSAAPAPVVVAAAPAAPKAPAAKMCSAPITEADKNWVIAEATRTNRSQKEVLGMAIAHLKATGTIEIFVEAPKAAPAVATPAPAAVVAQEAVAA